VPSDARVDLGAPARGGLVASLLASALTACDAPGEAAGATVTVVDVSIDALATLRRRAAEAGVADRVVAVQGDVEALADIVAPAAFDLVLAHGILEVVEPLAPSFAAIAGAVRPGGLLSILVSNPVAAVLARALAGDLDGAARELDLLDAGLPSPESIHALCTAAGFLVEQVHGIGVFRDLVPGAALDAPGAREALATLELACAQRRPFAEIAGRVHLLARRPPATPG
jgi:S-adenosylmethionine-dependent methyltransferase